MEKLALKYPEYEWQSNKGYPTKVHRDAIREHGSNKHHRKSFTLLPAQISLF
jgi:ribonuclease HII